MSSFLPLAENSVAYCRAFEAYRLRSRKLALSIAFFNETLPAHLAKIPASSSGPIRVAGIGSGSGAKDLVLFEQLLNTFPDRKIEVDIFEPGAELTDIFREAFRAAGLDPRLNVNFHLETSQQFRRGLTQDSKFDFMYALECLYYEDDIPKALTEYVEHLSSGGVLLVSHSSSNSGFHKMAKVYSPEGVLKNDFIGSDDVRAGLEAVPKALGVSWEECEMPNTCDISAIFAEGEEKKEEGGALMEFVTHVANFPTVASEADILQLKERLRQPEVCETLQDGRVRILMPFTVWVVRKN